MTPSNLCCLAIVFVENRHDLIKPDSAGLHRALDKADNLFKSGEYRWPILFLSKHVPLFLLSGFLSSSCLDTRQPGTVFKKLDTRQSEILTNFLEMARLIPLRT